MLIISPRTAADFHDRALPGFKAQLEEVLTDDHPHFLPCFPNQLRTKIVDNMVEHGLCWQLEHQDALHAYCEAMIGIAANFDAVPAIAKRMKAEVALSMVLPDVIEALPADLRREASANGSNLPFFVPSSLRSRSLAEQTAHALTIVLHDRPEADSPHPATSAAIAMAGELGWAALADGALIAATAKAFWGPQFTRLPWFDEFRFERWSPREQLELVRLRLALEFRRFA